MSNPKPYIIGVCGGSASGKTFFIRELLSQIAVADDVTLISQDNYYLKRENQKRDENGKINFDHPDAVDLNKFAAHLKKLVEGEQLELLEYTFNNPNATPRTIIYSPAPIIIVEGIFVYHNEAIRDQIDLKLFIDAEEHIKFSRRIYRDNVERGYDTESVIEMYNEFVMPMYKKYVAPTKAYCDMIIQNNKHFGQSVEVIANHIQHLINRG